ncbi:ABC transporter [Mycetocola zhujimingii]|uniref:ABC transporter n=1 Tax=Mycetocola zhujimingii TaxID=2079792 RepID=UPI001F233630|nr:ABC transporter [Mycetocola zhujimingii]
MRAVPVLVLCTFALTACSPPEPTPEASSTSALGDGHGYVAGAEEVQEPPLHLLTLGTDDAVNQLDLSTEEWTEVGTVDGATDAATDGRFVFVSDAAAGLVTIVDSGMWTQSHGDHFHYYRASSRIVGSIQETGPATVSAGSSATGIFFPESGVGVMLDNAALGEGDIVETVRHNSVPHDGSIVQRGESTLVTTADAGKPSAVQVLGLDASVTNEADCTGAGLPITTSVGVAYPCADGVLLATTAEDGIRFERIDYPASSAPPATSFAARKGRPIVAGLAGDAGVWLLDSRQRALTLLQTEVPLRQVTAVDDAAGHIIGLTIDGRVTVLSADDGAVLATTEPLLPETLLTPDLLGGVDLVADAQRVYLNAPAERALFEIDFADSARVARTFATGNIPLFFAETGR